MKTQEVPSIKSKLTQGIGLVCIIIALCVGFLFSFFARKSILNSADEKLQSAAYLYLEILGQDYHNQISDYSSISSLQYQNTVERNGVLCKQIGLQYLWSVLVLDDNIVFTSATHSDLNNQNSTFAKFFEVHKDPSAFLPAMETIDNPAFSTFRNEWGEGRMILIPKLDDKGRRYIIGASIQLGELNQWLHKSIFLAGVSGVFLFALVWFVLHQITNKFIIICSELTFSANEIRNGNLDVTLPRFNIAEAKYLAESFDDMKTQLKIRIIDLEKNNSILSSTLAEKNLVENKLKEMTEVQFILLSISSKYINLPIEKIDDGIKDALKELGSFVGADRTYIFEMDWKKYVCHNKYEWCAEGIPSFIKELQNIPFRSEEDWVKALRLGNAFYIQNVNELPDGYSMKQSLREQAILSLIMSPLVYAGECIGFVGFDWVKNFHTKTKLEDRVLSVFSEMLVNLRVRKEADLELSQFKYIADNSHYGKVISDLDGYILYSNNFFANIHGYHPEELYEKHLSIFHSEKQMDDVRKELERLRRDGFVDSSIIWHTHKNGDEFPMLMTTLLIRDDFGKPQYMAATAIDISELTQSQIRVENLLKIEAQLNQNLRNFTFIVSHNLRIHSANMIGILMMLEETEPEIFKNESIQMLKLASENLEETMQDLNRVLEIKLKSQIKKQYLNLHDVVNKVIHSLHLLTKEREVEVINSISSNVIFQSEPIYLSSILEQLIGNSIKYFSSDRKSWVNISCEVLEKETKIHVEDNGIGIDLKRNGEDLFKMYKKFHNSPDSKGLGLFLVQIQVETLGGKIEVQSELSMGSKFTVSFPHE